MSTEMIRDDGELQTYQSGALMPVMSIEQALGRYRLMTELASKVMKRGRDYGVIPGTERKAKQGEAPRPDNDVLLKPGAEKLCAFFGLVPDFQEDKVIVDFEKGIFFFSYRCVLLRDAHQEIIGGKTVIMGRVVGTGIGSCNSREKKYARGQRVCPECGVAAIIKGQEQYGSGWICWKKKGGCGAKFQNDDTTITDQKLVVDPADMADLVNTLQKMAQKRALISATLVATNASEFFTQDLEEAEEHSRHAEHTEEPQRNTISAETVDALSRDMQYTGLSREKACQHYQVKNLYDLDAIHESDLTQKVKARYPAWLDEACVTAMQEWSSWFDIEPTVDSLNSRLAELKSLPKAVSVAVWNSVILPRTQEHLIFDEKAKQFVFKQEPQK